jgi:tetratricopeptide (TPR) repeat protein/ADP-heptose:LPS heptosyltransferase
MDTESIFLEGLCHHLKGQLDLAEVCYRNVLENYPKHSDALHHLGLLNLQAGRIPQAITDIQRSLRLNPKQPNAFTNLGYCFNLIGEYEKAAKSCHAALELDSTNHSAWSNLGNAQRGSRLVIEARASYKKALSLQPANSRYIYNVGITFFDQGEFEEAQRLFQECLAIDSGVPEPQNSLSACSLKLQDPEAALYYAESAIKLKPNYSEAWTNRGAALNALKRYEDALASFDRSIELKSDDAPAWGNRGVTLNGLKRHKDALASYDRSIELKPDDPQTWLNRGVALNELKCHTDALASYDRSIELKPNDPQTWLNRGVALNELKRHADALASYDRSIDIKPDYSEAWLNRGLTLNELERHADALASYDRSIELKPDDALTWLNRGVTLSALNQHVQALASYEQSIKLKPEYSEPKHNRGLLQLARKEFVHGFQDYVWRWKTKNFLSQPIATSLPSYDPNSSAETILLWAEQGIGDEIFYAGMLAQALEKFSKISLVADKRLHSIFSRSFPEVTLLDREESKSRSFDLGFDAHAPIGDLGYILRLSNEKLLLSRKPFLIPAPNKQSNLRLVEPLNKKKIVCGLAWNSSNKEFGKEKSIRLSQLESIIKDPRLTFISLQYGAFDEEIADAKDRFGVDIHQIKDIDFFNNIDGLLTVIEACDVVITVSNITAHLAGSIGKKGCVLVPFSKGKIWYWHLNDTFSFWYPSLRIFYQNERYDWPQAIKQMRDWLEETFF